MSDFIVSLSADPALVTAAGRDARLFFGQGWSHYPLPFRHEAGGVKFYLTAYNTPRVTQVNWSVRDADLDPFRYDEGRSLWFALTPDESRALAARLGLPLGEWLGAALEACRTDVTPGRVAEDGVVVDLPNFHAARAGDDR
jgi:hypothetical protein